MFTWSLGCIGSLLPSLPPTQLDRPVGDHLVDVHVRLRARAGLPDVQRELGVQVAADDLVRDLTDQVGLPSGQPTGLAVDDRRGLLDVAVGVVDGLGHPVVADVEVDQRSLGLRAPVVVGRHLDLAERVALGTGSGGVQPDRQIQDLGRDLLSPVGRPSSGRPDRPVLRLPHGVLDLLDGVVQVGAGQILPGRLLGDRDRDRGRDLPAGCPPGAAATRPASRRPPARRPPRLRPGACRDTYPARSRRHDHAPSPSPG